MMLKIVTSNYYCYSCRRHLLLLLFPSSIINQNKNSNNNNNNRCLLHSPPYISLPLSPLSTDSLIPYTPVVLEERDAAAIINCLLAAIIQQRRLLDVNIDIRLHY